MLCGVQPPGKNILETRGNNGLGNVNIPGSDNTNLNTPLD